MIIAAPLVLGLAPCDPRDETSVIGNASPSRCKSRLSLTLAASSDRRIGPAWRSWPGESAAPTCRSDFEYPSWLDRVSSECASSSVDTSGRAHLDHWCAYNARDSSGSG